METAAAGALLSQVLSGSSLTNQQKVGVNDLKGPD